MNPIYNIMALVDDYRNAVDDVEFYRATIKQALAALERAERDGGWSIDTTKAITAMRGALEQPTSCPHNMVDTCCENYTNCVIGYARRAPQPREWFGLTDEEVRDLWSWSASAEAERTANTQQHAFARAIEAKLKEKNHG